MPRPVMIAVSVSVDTRTSRSRLGPDARTPVVARECVDSVKKWLGLDWFPRRSPDVGRQLHAHRRAVPDGTAHADRPAECLHQMFDDGQAQPGPAELARPGAVHAIEALE